MTPLLSLWLPILVASVIVFVASWLIHTVLPWHKGDYPRVPDEERARAAIGPLGIPPGDYMLPRAGSMEEMRTPEFTARMKEGPVVIMTVVEPGPISMGRSLGLWFIFVLVVSFFAAYVAGAALPPGAEYLEVFRFAGTTAFVGYALALWQMSIWYRRGWKLTVLGTVDGLIYGLLTGGAFGWLWPM